MLIRVLVRPVCATMDMIWLMAHARKFVEMVGFSHCLVTMAILTILMVAQPFVNANHHISV